MFDLNSLVGLFVILISAISLLIAKSNYSKYALPLLYLNIFMISWVFAYWPEKPDSPFYVDLFTSVCRHENFISPSIEPGYSFFSNFLKNTVTPSICSFSFPLNIKLFYFFSDITACTIAILSIRLLKHADLAKRYILQLQIAYFIGIYPLLLLYKLRSAISYSLVLAVLVLVVLYISKPRPALLASLLILAPIALYFHIESVFAILPLMVSLSGPLANTITKLMSSLFLRFSFPSVSSLLRLPRRDSTSFLLIVALALFLIFGASFFAIFVLGQGTGYLALEKYSVIRLSSFLFLPLMFFSIHSSGLYCTQFTSTNDIMISQNSFAPLYRVICVLSFFWFLYFLAFVILVQNGHIASRSMRSIECLLAAFVLPLVTTLFLSGRSKSVA